MCDPRVRSRTAQRAEKELTPEPPVHSTPSSSRFSRTKGPKSVWILQPGTPVTHSLLQDLPALWLSGNWVGQVQKRILPQVQGQIQGPPGSFHILPKNEHATPAFVGGPDSQPAKSSRKSLCKPRSEQLSQTRFIQQETYVPESCWAVIKQFGLSLSLSLSLFSTLSFCISFCCLSLCFLSVCISFFLYYVLAYLVFSFTVLILPVCYFPLFLWFLLSCLLSSYLYTCLIVFLPACLS